MLIEYTVNGNTEQKDLPDGSYIIGRKKTCDLILSDPSVSGQHVRLDIAGASVSIRDLMSKNGTKINGQKVDAAPVLLSDVISIGKIELRFLSDTVAEPVTHSAIQFSDDPVPEIEAGKPLDFTRPEASEHNEQTPVTSPIAVSESSGMTFDSPSTFPVANTQPKGAVVIVRPDIASTPVNNRKFLYVMGGFASLLLLMLLVQPIVFPPKVDRKPKLSEEKYMSFVTELARAFTRQEYDVVYEKSKELDEKWQSSHPSGPTMELAGYLTRLSEPFADAASGKTSQTDWRKLYTEHLDLDERNRFPVTLDDFVREIEQKLRLEAQQQEIFKKGEDLLARKRYDEAKAAFLEISSQSVYFTRVAPQVERCVVGRVAELQAQSKAAAEQENYEEAVRAGQQAQAIRNDDHFAFELKRWVEFYEVQQDLDQVGTLLSSKRYTDVKLAESIVNRLLENHLENPLVTKRLPDYRAVINKTLFLRKLAELYNAGDSDSVIKMHDEPIATAVPEAARIFNQFEQIYKDLNRADKSLAAKDYRGARAAWMSVLATEPNPENAFHKKALAKLSEWPLERIGDMERKAAMDAFRDGKYRIAREKLDFIQKECKLDISGELETIHDQGKKLYNHAINNWHDRLYAQATLELFEARDHFLPTEEWYKRINDRIIQLQIKDPRPHDD